MARINVRDDDDEEVEGNMTPMIDIIFLLLIFFILTTKFIPEEKVISNLLPTNKGTANASAPLEEVEQVNIKIIPGMFAGMTDIRRPSIFDAQWKESRNTATALYQVSGYEPFLVEGHNLNAKGGGNVEGAIEQVHEMLLSSMHLAEGNQYVQPRKDAPPVVIHGFSGLPWKYILVAYDAVRRYENLASGQARAPTTEDLLNAREVTFAPPRVRNFHEWEMGKEIFEIMHME